VSCRERRDAIFLHAAEALEDDERRALAAHLDTGCARCATVLAEAREALALLALSVDGVAPSDASRDRLLRRITGGASASERQGGRFAGARARRASDPGLRIALAAGIGVLAGAGLAAALAWRLAVAPLSARSAELEHALAAAVAELAELRDALADDRGELHALEAEARLAAEQVRLLRADGLEVMALAPADAAGAASGRIFWEPDDYACYFHAERLPAPGPGRSYVLWVVSARGEFFAAASFTPDARGEVALTTKLPRGFAPVARTLVTEEPSEHGEAPTGAAHLLGTVTKAGRS
jgi:hypothetical protein